MTTPTAWREYAARSLERKERDAPHTIDLRKPPCDHRWYFYDLDGEPFPGICQLCGVLHD